MSARSRQQLSESVASVRENSTPFHMTSSGADERPLLYGHPGPRSLDRGYDPSINYS